MNLEGHSCYIGNTDQSRHTTPGDMIPGQLGEIVGNAHDPERFSGVIVLRTYQAIVAVGKTTRYNDEEHNLFNLSWDWSYTSPARAPDFKIRLLDPFESVTLSNVETE